MEPGTTIEAASSREYADMVVEENNTEVPYMKEYESITEEEVESWGGATNLFGGSHVLTYFTAVLNGSDTLEEARENILSFREVKKPECETTGHPMRWVSEIKGDPLSEVLYRCSVCNKTNSEIIGEKNNEMD